MFESKDQARKVPPATVSTSADCRRGMLVVDCEHTLRQRVVLISLHLRLSNNQRPQAAQLKMQLLLTLLVDSRCFL